MPMSNTEPAQLASRVVYEDNHLIVVNKLPGELVQGDATGDEPLLEKTRRYIGWKHQKPGNVFCGLVHRLDRPTSGLVVMARTSKALTRMNKLFQQRGVQKWYYAITAIKPDPPEGLLSHYLRKNARQNKSYAVSPRAAGAKEARLSYRYLASSERYHLLQVELHTGRHHQIRAQLAALGAPIQGDLKYGFPRSNKDGSISLHAGKLQFVHPVKQESIDLSVGSLSSLKVWRMFNAKFTA